MKKIIGILGVAVIAATMFFNSTIANGTSSDSNLVSLTTLNKAYADDGEGTGGVGSCTVTSNCTGGSISCTSSSNKCSRGIGWVKCDGVQTDC